MRPVFWYILLVGAVAVIGMFFASQHSRHVQIGYELTRLRRERSAALERACKLDLEITKAAAHDALIDTARKLGLSLHGPVRRN